MNSSYSGVTPFLGLMVFMISQVSYAQDICQSMLFLKKGTNLEYTSYDKKDKLTGSQSMNVIDVTTEGQAVISTIRSEIKDKKGKPVNESTVNFKCENNTFYVDLRNYMDPSVYSSMSEMELSWEGDDASFPGTLKEGMNLDDAKITMEARMNGMKIMTMNMEIKNRKVEAREKITTPAGTFDCYKITYDTFLKAVVKREYRTTIWFSQEAGTVKSENYDKKGKLDSSTLLTKFNKA